ncbi:hypothetical protein B0H10DRAFT_2206441 [Mycena sp. CBHHK59/15]|nr:hypothetical protein B0H10DRAFT_2206441 [Mycena sp. CBHHK59/15]
MALQKSKEMPQASFYLTASDRLPYAKSLPRPLSNSRSYVLAVDEMALRRLCHSRRLRALRRYCMSTRCVSSDADGERDPDAQAQGSMRCPSCARQLRDAPPAPVEGDLLNQRRLRVTTVTTPSSAIPAHQLSRGKTAAAILLPRRPPPAARARTSSTSAARVVCPRQTAGPLTLTPEDIRRRMTGLGGVGMRVDLGDGAGGAGGRNGTGEGGQRQSMDEVFGALSGVRQRVMGGCGPRVSLLLFPCSFPVPCCLFLRRKSSLSLPACPLPSRVSALPSRLPLAFGVGVLVGVIDPRPSSILSLHTLPFAHSRALCSLARPSPRFHLPSILPCPPCLTYIYTCVPPPLPCSSLAVLTPLSPMRCASCRQPVSPPLRSGGGVLPPIASTTPSSRSTTPSSRLPSSSVILPSLPCLPSPSVLVLPRSPAVPRSLSLLIFPLPFRIFHSFPDNYLPSSPLSPLPVSPPSSSLPCSVAAASLPTSRLPLSHLLPARPARPPSPAHYLRQLCRTPSVRLPSLPPSTFTSVCRHTPPHHPPLPSPNAHLHYSRSPSHTTGAHNVFPDGAHFADEDAGDYLFTPDA